MDFLDPAKTKRRNQRLIVGYIFLAVLISLGTVILVYLSYGFGLNKNGGVYQNGLIYVASSPTNADISLNSISNGKTNSRINTPAGQYILKINKSGYRQWQRSIEVDGASVQHFDYPLLIPTKLVSNSVTNYASTPTLSTQSPDKRWMVVQNINSVTTFSEYDLNTKPLAKPTALTIPNGILSNPNAGDILKAVQWSTDNIHILLSHQTVNGNEYILMDRQNPANTININKTLSMNPGSGIISLSNSKYDQYYIYKPDTKVLYRANLNEVSLNKVLSGVLAYKTFGSKMVLYASEEKVSPNTVAIRLLDDQTNYNLRLYAAGSNYYFDMAQNNGNWFVVTASTLDNRAFVYENPEQTLQQFPNVPLAPVDIMKVEGVNYVQFSADKTKIVAENGLNIATYDNFANNSYSFTLPGALDSPQTNVTWMDGERFVYVSSGVVNIIDYDGINLQQLVSGNSSLLPLFNVNFKYLYTVAPSLTQDKLNNYTLNQTPIRLAADL
jgi:hypothetical protein